MLTIDEMKKRKIQYGYTNTLLSELSGVPVGTVNKIFSGETKQPRRETLLALDKLLSADPVAYSSTAFMLRGLEQGSATPVMEGPSSDFGPGGLKQESEPGGAASDFVLRDSASVASSYRIRPEISDSAPGGACDGVEICGKKPGEYTIEDYLALPDDKRVELIDGFFYDMAGPKIRHQQIAGELFISLTLQIREKGGSCQVFMSPVDVYLCEDQQTVVQPDVQIVCDPSKITEKSIVGAPDFVLEVISPSTGFKDYTIKLHKYQEAGVREYWIADPIKKRLMIFYFEGEEVPQILPLEGQAALRIFGGEVSVDLDRIRVYCE